MDEGRERSEAAKEGGMSDGRVEAGGGGEGLFVVILSFRPHTTLNLSREIWRN